MQQMIPLYVILSVGLLEVTSLSKPINSRLTLKITPITAKNVKPKKPGAFFAKNQHEQLIDDGDDVRQNMLSKAYFLHSAELGIGCTNHIAKILFPFMNSHENESMLSDTNYINIPIIQQPFTDYKIVVATAPPNIKISGPGAKPLLVYIVFPEDEAGDVKRSKLDIPSIYFVKKEPGQPVLKNKYKVDPILIIDSNRTVTGLKSKEVAKFLKFKNRLTNRNSYKYAVAP